MALIPVAVPTASPRGPGTFEKVVSALDLVAKFGGLALTGVEIFERSKDRQVRLEDLRLQRERQASLDETQQLLNRLQIESLSQKVAKAGKEIQLTPAELEVDKEFGKEIVDFRNRGGFADVEKSLGQLKEVAASLKDVEATGPIMGLIPKAVRDIVAPKSAAIQDSVEEVVQRNLRLILGAQFTEREGVRLIERAFNPRLDEKENLKRVNRLITQIEDAANAKKDSVRYFEEHGTLKGFRGKVVRTLSDVIPPEEQQDKPVELQEDLDKKFGIQ